MRVKFFNCSLGLFRRSHCDKCKSSILPIFLLLYNLDVCCKLKDSKKPQAENDAVQWYVWCSYLNVVNSATFTKQFLYISNRERPRQVEHKKLSSVLGPFHIFCDGYAFYS